MKQLDLSELKTRKRQPKKVQLDSDTFCYVLNPSPDQADLAQMQFQAYRNWAETNKVGFTKFLVAYALADENNNQLIGPGESEDVLSTSFIEMMDTLAESMEYRAIKIVFDAAMSTFGLSDSDVEELEKN